MASIGKNVQNHIESSIYMSNSAFYDQMKLNSFELCFELCTGCFELCTGWYIKRVMVDFGGLNFYNCPNSFVCIVMINSVFKKMMPRLYIFSSSFYTYRVAQKKKTHCRFNQFCTCIEIMNSVSKKMMARLYISSSNLYMYRVAQKKRHIVDFRCFFMVESLD